MNFGGKHLQDKVVKDCLQGKKFICLAITEPYAGSDVAGLRTTAVKDPSGKFYVVNGEKKWYVRLNSESQHRLPADRDA
jgi:alkylation response protein AidB-like acyl-CoA dehydrogenase